MDTKIIGQGYNMDADTSVAKELIEQFNSKRYDSFTCLVAFASYGGITALTPYILAEKERGVKINIILGIDQKGRADAGSVNRAVTQFCLHYLNGLIVGNTKKALHQVPLRNGSLET